MLRPEDSEKTWKPEQVLNRYRFAIDCAERRGDEIAVRALRNAFVCAWTRAARRMCGVDI